MLLSVDVLLSLEFRETGRQREKESCEGDYVLCMALDYMFIQLLTRCYESGARPGRDAALAR